ncbi:MAG: hypothetical protein GTO14_13280, partial [Anaerolineales bacterium]|nr:hypothetical protein [Anaerolineales bacterium]
MVDWVGVLMSMLFETPSQLGPFLELEYLLFTLPVIAFLNDLFGRDPSSGEGNPKSKKMTERERILLRQLQQFRTLLRMAGSLSSTLNYERVLEMSLDLAYGVLEEPGLPASSAVGALMLFSEDQLYIATA